MACGVMPYVGTQVLLGAYLLWTGDEAQLRGALALQVGPSSSGYET